MLKMNNNNQDLELGSVPPDFDIGMYQDLTKVKSFNIYCDNFSLEYPLFTPSQTPIKKALTFDVSFMKVKLSPNVEFGLTTMSDKEVWIYILSKSIANYLATNKVNRYLTFSAYDCFKFFNKENNLGASSRTKIVNALKRLKGTVIDISGLYGEVEYNDVFSYIDRAFSFRLKGSSKGVYYVHLSDYALGLIVDEAKYYKVHAEYFSVNGYLKRRLYEISLIRCSSVHWMLGVDKLQERVGSIAERKSFVSLLSKNLGKCLNFAFSYDRKGMNFSTTKMPTAKTITLKHLSKKELIDLKVIGEKDPIETILEKVDGKYYVIDIHEAQTRAMINIEAYPDPKDIIKYEEEKNNKLKESYSSSDKVVADAIEEEPISISNSVKELMSNIGGIGADLVENYDNLVFNIKKLNSVKRIDIVEAFKCFGLPVANLKEGVYIHDTVVANDPEHFLSRWTNDMKSAGYLLTVVGEDGKSRRVSSIEVAVLYKDYCCQVLGLNRIDY